MPLVEYSSSIVPPISPTSVPPDSQPPKTRPPTSLRDSLPPPVSKSLPYYTGSYSVGTIDLEIPVREPRTFGKIKRGGKHLLKLETVLMTVFYPSELGTGGGKSPEGKEKWGRMPWLPRPRVRMARGYGAFANMPEWLSVAWFGMTTAFAKLSAFRNALLATNWPPNQNAHEAGYESKNQFGTPPPNGPEAPTFPLLVFSHGLGGTRTTYSSLCGEFASYWFVVVAIEHRDGSGPRTFGNLRGGVEGKGAADWESGESQVSANADKEKKKSTKKQKTSKGHRYEKMDYVFPKDNKGYDAGQQARCRCGTESSAN